MTLKKPLMSGSDLVADIESADPQRGAAFWWLGQSGFLVKAASGRVLFDPYLSDSLTRKYAESDKPHTRMTELAVAPESLRSVDVVTSSHNHTDHLDAETLQAVLATNPSAKLVIPEANRMFAAERLQCDPAWPLGLTDGESLSVGEIEIHAVPAAHNEISRDEAGRCRCLGYVVRLGQVTIYHSGDTLAYPDMVDRLRPFAIDVALLPINGNRPERRVAGNLFGNEAAQLARDIGARLVLPCHYDMFQFNTESPELFAETCRRLGQPYQVPRCGQRLTIGDTMSS